jgi:hypothetical protein
VIDASVLVTKADLATFAPDPFPARNSRAGDRRSRGEIRVDDH